MADAPQTSAAINELAAIPFGALIGGPLIAAIEAQAHAAMTTVDFIKAVGFSYDKKKDENTVNTVKFSFMNGYTGGSNGRGERIPRTMTLEVPLLSIIPIPFLRIENLDIHFKASLSQSMENKETESTSLTREASVSAGGGWLCFRASMKGSISSKKDSSSTRDSRYATEYTMDINVHAVQDDIPAGLSRVLGMLNETMERQLQAPAPGPLLETAETEKKPK